MRIEEKYPTGGVPTITLTGRDDMYKMVGGNKRGTLKKGESGDKLISGKKALEQAVIDTGLTPKVTAPSDTKYRAPSFMNENPYQAAKRLLYGIGPE